MALPILAPLRALLGAQAADAAGRAATGAVTVCLAAAALSLLGASGLVALSHAVGFPVAALVFATGLAVLALAVHLAARAQASRRAARFAAARQRLATDVAVAAALSRSAQPFLPLVAFAAAFAVARRP